MQKHEVTKPRDTVKL